MDEHMNKEFWDLITMMKNQLDSMEAKIDRMNFELLERDQRIRDLERKWWKRFF